MFMARLFIHLASLAPLSWLGWQLWQGDESQFGADPIKEIQHFLGFSALTLLACTFLLGIILKLANKNQFQILRRPLGLWAWFYVVLHISAYWLLELGAESALFFSEIFSRPYLWLGLLGAFILTLMALSSLPQLKKVMGKYWFYLHKFGYLALVAGAIHYYWSVKNIELGAILLLSFSLFVLAWELYFGWWRKLTISK